MRTDHPHTRQAQGTNYYDVLQVSPTASQEVIQAAYRALARGYHPDLNPTPAAAVHMSLLNAAYDVLGDTERRAAYDLQRVRASRRPVAVIPVTPVTLMRGTPAPNSTRRTDEKRISASASVGTRPRTLMTVLLMTIVAAVTLSLALWLMMTLLDDGPSTYPIDHNASSAPSIHRVSLGTIGALPGGLPPAQPFLNRA